MKKLRIYSILIPFSVLLSILTMNRINTKLGIPSIGRDATMILTLYVLSLIIIYIRGFSAPSKSMRSNLFMIVLSLMPATFFLTKVSVYPIILLISIPIGFFVGKKLYIIHNELDSNNFVLTLILLPAIIGSIWSLFISRNIALFDEGRDFIFSIVIFTPLIYYCRNYILRFILIFLFAYVALMSAKRTAIILIVASLCLYLLYNVQYVRKNKSKVVLFLLTAFILYHISGTLNIFDNFNDAYEMSLERMQNLDDASNDNRRYMISTILGGVSSSNILNLIFGHGYNAVTKNLFGNPAHNDYLEMFYDYGIIALLFYMVFILRLVSFGIAQIFRNKRVRSNSFYLVNTILIFLLLSFLNCILINPLYIYVLMLAIGWSFEHSKIKLISNE